MAYEEVEIENTEELAVYVRRLIDACEQHSEQQQRERKIAIEFYSGDVSSRMDPAPGGADNVSNDVRATVKKILPSIMRSILANDSIVEYQPVREEDEGMAKQATRYVNHVVMQKPGAEEAIHDAIFDACVVGTGILKWSAYSTTTTKISTLTGVGPDALLGIEGAEGVEIIETTERPSDNPDATAYDYEIRQVLQEVDVKLDAIPRDSFLIYPQAWSIKESPIVGERLVITRSEMVSRGYDKGLVDELACYERSTDDHSDDSARRGVDWSDKTEKISRAAQEVLVYEVYVTLDLDNDGITEIYRVIIGDGNSDRAEAGSGGIILSVEQVESAPYAEVVIERDAHQFEGHSIAQDVVDIQRVKTFFLRAAIDNANKTNHPQPAIDPSGFTTDGVEALASGEPGRLITMTPGRSIPDSLSWLQMPDTTQNYISALQYMNEVLRDETGISESSSGLDPEAFQNMTATSAQIMAEQGAAQVEMIIRTLARGGLRKAFKGLLKLVIAHSDGEEMLRVNNTWERVTPGDWDPEMDCVINVGLGAGSRERDLQGLQIMLSLQEKVIAGFGPDNPFVSADNLYNTLTRIAEAIGFPGADPYFTKPDPQKVAAALQQGNQPSEAQLKVEAQMQLEQAKAQAQTQKERAQMEADLHVKQAELEKEGQIAMLKAAHDKEMKQMQLEIDLLKHREEMALKESQLGLDVIKSAEQPFTAGSVYNAR